MIERRGLALGAKGVALFAMAWLLLFTVLMREDWVAQTSAIERREAELLLGRQRADELAERGARWSDALLEDTGLADASYALFTLPPAERARDADFGTAVPWFDRWFERRLDALFALVRQGFRRASFALPWLPAGLLLVLVAIVDGLVRRQIRRCTFAYSSPVIHRGGIAVIKWIGVASLLSLVAPWPQPAWLFPVLLLLLALAGGAIAANVQKDF